MKTFLYFCTYTVIICLVSFTLFFVKDVLHFHAIQRGNYDTPWYYRNWVLNPYTNFRIAIAPTETGYSTNGNYTERWVTRETVINGKEWWTIIERYPLNDKERVKVLGKNCQ